MSDHLDRLRAQARESLWDDDGNDWTPTPEPTPQSIHAVKHDMFDEMSWKMLLDQIGPLRDSVHALAEDHGTSQEAQEDLFNLLYQSDPLFRDASEVKPGHRPQRDMLEALAGSEPFEELRDSTVLDEYGTAFAQLTLQEPLREAFDELSKAQEAQQAAQDALRGCGGFPGGQGGDDPDPEALQEALDKVEQAQKDADEIVEKHTKSLESKVQEVSDDLAEEAEAIKAHGNGPGELKYMSFEERRALSERLHKSRLSQLAKLIGSWRQFGDAERRRKVKYTPAEIFDIDMGNDLTQLVPDEFNNLAVPELEDLFWLRWAQHSLLQWKVEGNERAGQGPIIVMCDESESMTAELDKAGNTREAWSKALSLALADQAKRSGRDFTYIGFASSYQQWERTFVNGQMTLADTIEFTEHFFCGGTSYEEPLTRAMEIAEEYGRKDKGMPDLVLITDDECKVSPAFVESFAQMKSRLDAKCYGLQVGGSAGATIKSLSDRTLNINKLTASPEGVKDLFRTI